MVKPLYTGEAEARGDGTAAPVAFFTGTYDEALTLLDDTRAYMADREGFAAATPDAGLRMMAVKETTRVVARITQIMAWLTVQRAVHAGEMTRQDALAPRYRLGGQDICLPDGTGDAVAADARLWRLLERSRELYVRVLRLDERAARYPQA